MYNEQLEQLIDAALIDGELTEKEKQILLKKAQTMGVDLDEFEMVLGARLYKHSLQQSEAMSRNDESAIKDVGTSNSSIKENSSSQHLSQLLDNYTNEYFAVFKKFDNNDIEPIDAVNAYEQADDMIKNTILNFPTPSDKKDMLDFMLYLKTQVQQSEQGTAFLSKYLECIEKVEQLYPEDSDFKSFIELTKGTKRLKVGPKGMSSYKFKKLIGKNLSLFESTKEYMRAEFDDDDDEITQYKIEVTGLITSFPLPSDRDDLIDFMLYLSKQARESEFSKQFKKKFEECANKAIALYPNDYDIRKVANTTIQIPITTSIRNVRQSVKHGFLSFAEVSVTVINVIVRVFKTLFILAIIALIVWVVGLILGWF